MAGRLGGRELVLTGELERELAGVSMPELAAREDARAQGCAAAGGEDLAGVFRALASGIATGGQLVSFAPKPGLLYAGGMFQGLEFSFTGSSTDTWRALVPGRAIRFSGKGSLYIRSISGETLGRLTLEHYAAPPGIDRDPVLFATWAGGLLSSLGPVVPPAPSVSGSSLVITSSQSVPLSGNFVGAIGFGKRVSAGDVVPLQVDGTIGNVNLRVSDWTPGAVYVADGANSNALGSILSYTVAAGFHARLLYASMFTNGGAPVFDLEYLPGGLLTIKLVRTAAGPAVGLSPAYPGAALRLGVLVAGDIIRWNVTTVGGAGSTADGLLAIEELIDT